MLHATGTLPIITAFNIAKRRMLLSVVQNTGKRLAVGLLIVSHGFLVFAAAPPMREQVNLAGSWPQGGTVPLYTVGANFSSKTFQRSMTIPAAWTGKKIFLELEAVNYSDVTSIDNTQIGTSTGGWLPHAYDITSRVTPGQTHTLTMIVGGHSTVSGDWPCSWNPASGSIWDGLIYDVYLRAYGMVAIRDAEVITSVTGKTITVKYEVQNFSSSSRTVTVNANIYPSTGGASVLSLAANSTTLAAGQKQVVQVLSSWATPNLWWPDDPKLYHLCSAVKESGATIDSQTVRFGFREMKISGRNLMLNGVRINLRGESIAPEMSGSFFFPASVELMRARIAMEKSVNGNSVRWHVKIPPNVFVDECDEMGLINMPEAPLWQQSDACGSGTVLNTWIPAWIKSQRNHASILQWSAENECYGIEEATALAMNRAITNNDGNLRPVWHEDVRYSSLPTSGVHYPESYPNLPNAGIIYDASWISATVPTSCGETVGYFSGADYRWWSGIYPRGMRYNNVAVIHLYHYDTFIGNSSYTINSAYIPQRDLLSKAYAPVALFDYGYDGLGIGPIKDNSYPSIAAGSTANRTLVLYNDEFSNNIVTVQVDVKSGTTTYATATKSYQIELGNHITVPCGFQVPYVGGSVMDLVLTTRKGTVQKFTESKRFNVTGGSSGTSSSTVALGGNAVNIAAPYIRNLPAKGQTTGLVVGIFRGKPILRLPVAGATGGGPVEASLFDLRGSLIGSSSAATRDDAPVQLGIDGTRLAPGQYIVQVKTDGREIMQRVNIAR